MQSQMEVKDDTIHHTPIATASGGQLEVNFGVSLTLAQPLMITHFLESLIHKWVEENFLTYSPKLYQWARSSHGYK